MTTIEIGVRTATGEVIKCDNPHHAEGLLESTSIVLGPKKGREIVTRTVSDWTPR